MFSPDEKSFQTKQPYDIATYRYRIIYDIYLFFINTVFTPTLTSIPYLPTTAWAKKRGYFIRSKGVPDAFRAANELLRFCLNGQKSLVLYLRPPGYSQEAGEFSASLARG